jgi:hypothetical protein
MALGGDLRPQRRLPQRVVEASELSRAIGVLIYKLERLAAIAMLDFHHSATHGIWIRRDQLSRWVAAARAYPGFMRS